jgi:hypothetical protein
MVLRLTELTLDAPKSNVAKFFDPIAAIKLLKSSLSSRHSTLGYTFLAPWAIGKVPKFFAAPTFSKYSNCKEP